MEDLDRLLASVEPDEDIPSPFSTVLLSAGIIQSIATMTHSLVESDPKTGIPIPLFSSLLGKAFVFLNRILSTTRGHCFIRDAIEAGLLRVVASCGAAGKFQKTLTSFLENVLPRSLLYYYDVHIFEAELLKAHAVAIPKRSEPRKSSALGHDL